MDQDQNDAPSAIKDLHRDLARKYRIHGPKVETLWRSFSKSQRTKALRDGSRDGEVLKHRNDPSLGNVCKFVPELNLRDLTEPGDDALLKLLQTRATTSLMEQFPGDCEHIVEMTRTRNLHHINEDRLKNSYALFLDNDQTYGTSYTITAESAADRPKVLARFQPAIDAGLCIPQATAELIFMRQATLLQVLNIVIEDILDIGSTTRIMKMTNTPRNKADATTAAMAKLSVQARPATLSLADLLDTARDQEAALDEYLNLLSAEPVVLAQDVNHAFFSRPELVADEKGRFLPVHTDRFISSAFFEAVDTAVKATATWDYITRLLMLLEKTTDKAFRASILQEISNTCHLEYGRTQSLVKRHLQTATGSKCFRRVSNVYDNGVARVSMKIKPEELTRSNPQLHYYLRLCHPDTTASKAVEWLEKLDKLHSAHADERERLSEREFAALCDHTVIVAFIQDLALGISIPPLSRKKGQLFVTRSKELEGELNQIRDHLDLTDFVVPIDHLLEPGNAQSALEALEAAVIGKTGSKLGFMYQDMIEDCLADLVKQYQQIAAKVEKKDEPVFIPVPSAPSSQTSEARVERRRQKEKTRPAHSSVFDFVPKTQEAAAPSDTHATQRQTFSVKPCTADVFKTLFDKSESRGAVSWVSFEAAMADLGFSVFPKFGSVYTFLPPPKTGDMVMVKLTVHRPHQANIEGYRMLIIARRLKRLYGWNKDTFQIATVL